MKATFNLKAKAAVAALSCLMMAAPAVSTASGILVFDGAAAANALDLHQACA